MAYVERKYQNWWTFFLDTCDVVRTEDIIPFKNDKGESWLRFYFDPEGNTRLRNRYDLKVGEEINPNTGLVEKEYPAAYVLESRSPAPDRKFYFVFLDFNGGKTKNTNFLESMAEEIRLLEMAKQSLTIQLHKLQYEMDELRNDTKQSLMKQAEFKDAIRGRPQPSQDIGMPPNINMPR